MLPRFLLSLKILQFLYFQIVREDMSDSFVLQRLNYSQIMPSKPRPKL